MKSYAFIILALATSIGVSLPSKQKVILATPVVVDTAAPKQVSPAAKHDYDAEMKKRAKADSIWAKFNWGFSQQQLSKLHRHSNSSSNNYERERMYIQRFAPIAVAEMKKFGIPASITLAQGIIESDRGACTLSNPEKSNANNHFGIKGRGTKAWTKEYRHHKGGKVPESHHFRKFSSPWESYREHSLLFYQKNRKHYSFLISLPTVINGNKSNYKAWAMVLGPATREPGHKCRYAEQCPHPQTVATPWGYDDKNYFGTGYATSRTYPRDLSRIIDKWELWRLDELYTLGN